MRFGTLKMASIRLVADSTPKIDALVVDTVTSAGFPFTRLYFDMKDRFIKKRCNLL